MSDAAATAEAHRRAAILADLANTGRVSGSYLPGDHLHEQNLWDGRSGRDELEAITPRAQVEHATQDAALIACPHGMDDDRDCRRCMDAFTGTAAPVIAATKRNRRAA